MTVDLLPTQARREPQDIFQDIVRLYVEIVVSNEPSLQKTRMDMLRTYSEALRQLRRIDRAAKAASPELPFKKGVKK